MPVATHVLQGDFSALVGEVATIRATIHTNSTDDAWVNDTDDEIRLGGAVLTLNAAGEFTITLPTSTGTGLQYQVTAEYVNANRQRKTWQSGWFDLTADADLADKANDSTLRINTTLGDQLAQRIDGYTDHGDVSGTLAVDPATGTHVLNATDALLVTLAAESDGRIVTLYVIGGAENVTVDGMADLELTDGAFASFVRIRGAWVLASAGASAGEPATPDTTPPSAVTDLAVTPGSDGVTATATFSPATDAESTVKYRYRLYATGSTAPAWPTSGSQYNLAGSPINLTGLTVGEDYTMDLQAYSAGGSAAADTATFTTPTPAGWNVWDTIDFADQTAGTFAPPKDFTTDTGKTLRAVLTVNETGSVVVGSGKVKGVYQQTPIRLSYPSDTTPTASRVTIPFDLVGTNTSYGPGVRVNIGMGTGSVNIEMALNWETGTSRRMQIGPNYGSGFVRSAGLDAAANGYTLSGEWLNGLPTTGTLVLEAESQILKAYVNGLHIYSVDFTNNLYGGSPNPLVGNFVNAEVSNDGAIYSVTVETYS